MATVIVAVGSNVGNRHQHLSDAKQFLSDISEAAIDASSIYITEPVGPATRDFYNAAVRLTTTKDPNPLIKHFKRFEAKHGRPKDHPKWSARTIDLDIISYNDLVIQTDTLIIPHPEYQKRLFVLKPLQEIAPSWIDPKSGQSVSQLIEQAPDMRLKKMDLRW